jgi:hypothetical protein
MPTVGGIVVSTGSESSGRRTLGDVVDELARPIDASDTTVRAIAADAFRAAVRTMNRKGNWPWELQDESMTMSVNGPHTTVTGAIKKPLAMYFTDSSNLPDERIGYIEYEKLVETYDMSLAGRPCLYSVPNTFETGQIRWYPIPQEAETCQLTYYRVTPAPQVETETIEVPDHAIEVYTAFAWFEFAKRLPAAATRYPLNVAKADAMLAFKEIVAHVNQIGDRVGGY